MSVMMRNGVQYAGEPTDRLDSIEEIIGDGQQSVGSDLTDAVTQLNSSLDGIKIKYISSPLTIPDGTISSPKTVKVDISTFLPQGTNLMGIIGKMDDYPFPYVSDSGVVQTWLFVVGNTVQIKNITSGWGTRILHLIILYR